MTEYIILISGSRDWEDYELIRKTLKETVVPENTTPVLIHGGCRGADLIADRCAKELGWKIRSYPISAHEWKTIGKRAGPDRNKRMIDTEQPHVIYCFRKNNSAGTTSTINLATEYGRQLTSRIKSFVVFDNDRRLRMK